MSNGWNLVARLGTQGAGYPHVLVDSHGWCLRLGPLTRRDDKYYSSFSNLLQGLVEHLLRRRMKSGDALEGVQALARAVEGAIREAGELSRAAKETVIHEHIRRCGLLDGVGRGAGGDALPALVQSPVGPVRREATPAI